ncbi:Small auxin-up RNA protein [Dioscorea alata]|uniref:Small auxin-up RNA protein n=1 Tax=Dioscorea alata TaxID=55571 RepID=A0ACB7UD41_DIOAL|nr:Small auxin-up RNA protein [Dioscorea alata]
MATATAQCDKIQHRKRAAAASSGVSSSTQADVPGEHVAVCVDISQRRFIVHAAHLNHPAFSCLLSQAEEEYGFAHYSGPIVIPCDESLFEEILRRIVSSPAKLVSSDGFRCCCCCGGGATASGRIHSSWRSETLPLLRGISEKPVW